MINNVNNPYSGRELEVRLFNSIHEIQESVWDSLVEDKEFYHTHKFLQVMEDSLGNECQFFYVLFYDLNKLVGGAALSVFTVSLDLLMESKLKHVVQSVRKIYNRFLKVRILFCGLPVSIGKNSLIIGDSVYTVSILEKLISQLNELSKKNKIQYICLKEFQQELAKKIDWYLLKHHFFRLPSLPYVSLQIKWENFQSYLESLRYSYRRQIKKQLIKYGMNEPVILSSNSDTTRTGQKLPIYRISDSKYFEPEVFHKLYLNVMEHAQTKIEVLKRDFFRNFFQKMSGKNEILYVTLGNEIIGAAMLNTNRKIMTFILIGLNYSKQKKYDVYFNLIYSILKLAIDRRCERLDLGQTSYYAKQRVGGKCVPTYFYLTSRNKYIYFLLKKFKGVIFPETNYREYMVFKSQKSDNCKCAKRKQ